MASHSLSLITQLLKKLKNLFRSITEKRWEANLLVLNTPKLEKIVQEDKIIVLIRTTGDLARNNLTPEENLIKDKDSLAVIDLLDQEKKKEIGNQLNALSVMDKDTYQETVHKMKSPK